MTNEELAANVKEGKPWATLELWEAVQKYVGHCAGKYRSVAKESGIRVEFDDLVQDGFLAMMDAVEIFDPERGGSFIGSLNFCLKKRFAEEIGVRSSKRDAIQFSVSTEAQIYDNEDSPTLEETLKDPGGEYAFCLVEFQEYRRYCRRLIKSAMKRITPQARRYILRYYFSGETLEAIAGDRGSREAPRQVIARGLRTMKGGKYRKELWEALQGFNDFAELSSSERSVEYCAIKK